MIIRMAIIMLALDIQEPSWSSCRFNGVLTFVPSEPEKTLLAFLMPFPSSVSSPIAVTFIKAVPSKIVDPLSRKLEG